MNALKRVKKLIAIGLLANTLYITPIWAQGVQLSDPAAVANIPTLVVFLTTLQEDAILLDKSGVFRNTNDEVISKNDVVMGRLSQANGNLEIAFSQTDSEKITALDSLTQTKVFWEFAIQASNLNRDDDIIFRDSEQKELASATIVAGTVANIDIMNRYDLAGAELMDTEPTDSGTFLTPQKPEGQSGPLKQQNTSGGGAAGAASTLTK
jgi:hypothetical protein